EDAERVLRSVLEGGAALGAKYLTFHGPMQLKKLPFTPDPARVAARMSAVMDICRVYGITPAYENVHYTYGATPAYLAGLCRLLPDLRITLDVKQARQAGVSELDFIRAVGDRIVTVHLCDVLPSNVPALPGRGVVDFSALFAALSARRISAPCLLEVYPGDYKTLDELEACFHALKRLANST
ncbi:MAG: sugar phosphate isomerase/epimerase, partial [Clostridiales bacterium]|nr:sugar phosphate isomerase/epimerase [Clostridiales bacterium]